MSGAVDPTVGPIDCLQQRLGHTFRTPSLLEEALSHSSLLGDGRRHICNERLEFLGDRVLGLVVADMLIRGFPREDEGSLARRLAALVSRAALVEVVHAIELAPCLILARGEEEAGGRQNPGLLADACEAVIAAVFLDGGFECAAAVVRRLWQPLVERDIAPPKDAKTLLQEWAQGSGRTLPRYRETERTGPAHAPLFRVEVCIDGIEPVVASGPSKRSAERAAAEVMLARVGLGCDRSNLGRNGTGASGATRERGEGSGEGSGGAR